MKQNIMKKWVKALRSGNYKQGTGTLKQYNRKGEAQHCCLGVLCDLYNDTMKKNKKKTLPVKTCDNDSDFSYGYTRFGNKRDDLPKEVMDWAGISSSLAIIGRGDCLADLNDTGRTFKTIANIIENNYKNL